MVLYSKCCFPAWTNDEKSTVDEDVGKLDTYQELLNEIMTISTLLLGFILTGTMLSITFTGEEHYGSWQVRTFVLMSGFAALLAGVSLITAFATSIQAAQFYGSHSATHALHHMKRSLLAIFVSEFTLYASLMVFLFSVADFSYLAYEGPDICPQAPTGPDKAEEIRMASFCGKLGEDFYEAVQASGKSCSSLFPGSDLQDMDVCEHYAEIMNGTTGMAKFIWNNAASNHNPQKGGHRASEARLQMLLTVSDLHCKKTALQDSMDAACVKDPGSLECAQFSIAFRQADECEDSTTDDAERCYKVCHWRDKSTLSMHDAILSGLVPVILLTLWVILVRLYTTAKTIYYAYNCGRGGASSRELTDGADGEYNAFSGTDADSA
eukprot:TRINITY_DN19289_c0_g1_i1.p1 TRINITY_DN19289_c0_g1~~TRINITY_DN19289_c0_g1_i1.p1  ORF type:complete len:380 (+),score=79.42 TRINITY_DN19289_c0_g1_i1:105-1244(+)